MNIFAEEHFTLIEKVEPDQAYKMKSTRVYGIDLNNN